MIIKNWFKAFIGTIGALLWLGVFSAGLFHPAKVAVDDLAQHFDGQTFVVAILTFTPTNIFLLTCLASLIGGCASNLVYAKSMISSSTEALGVSAESVFYLTENPAASMLRGFAVYLTFIAGIYIASNQPFALVTPDQFARIAGTTSAIAFGVGYDPTIFRNLVGGLLSKTGTGK